MTGLSLCDKIWVHGDGASNYADACIACLPKRIPSRTLQQLKTTVIVIPLGWQ
jgi:hypothetical protein